MRPRRAIILARRQDRGSGLDASYPPSCLVEVGGRPLLDLQLDTLAACGIRRVWLAVDHDEPRLRNHVGSRADLLRCRPDGPGASLRSTWFATPQVRAGALVVSADVLFAPELLARLLAAEYPDALLLDSQSPPSPGKVQAQLAGEFVVDLGKDLPAGLVAGECVGLLKLGPEGGRRLVRVAVRMTGREGPTPSAVEAVGALAGSWPVLGVDARGLPWARIDDLTNLARTARLVLPHLARAGARPWTARR